MKTTLTFLQFLKDIGLDFIVIIAGTAGGYVLATKSEKLTWWQKLGTMLSGGLTANYLTPLVAEWLSLSDNALCGVAFFVGFGGHELVKKTFLLFQNKLSTTNKLE